jgi:hypothetical protein
MSDPTTTRRQLLHRIGASALTVAGSIAGCLGRSDDTTERDTQHTPTPTTTPTATPTQQLPEPDDLPERPYTALTPAIEQTPLTRSYRVIATKPLRARRNRSRLGDAYTEVWMPPGYGANVTFAARAPFAAYFRDTFDTDGLADYYDTMGGDELATYREFQRYEVSAGLDPVVSAFTENAEYTVTDGGSADRHTLSKSLIDLYHGDGHSWQRDRASYATLVEHLPQGLSTVVYPTGMARRPSVEASFGQTLTLPDGDDSTVQLRTVIVYEPDVDVDERAAELVSSSRINLFPVTDPTVTTTDTAVRIDDHADVSDVRWP